MILFIDDDIRVMDTYVGDLRASGYDAHQERTVDEGLKFLRENFGQIDVLVLDIMMDEGGNFSDADIQNGLRTGVFLFEKIRDEHPELPVVILTNVSAEPVEMAFAGRPRCLFLLKPDWYAFELVEEIKAMAQTNIKGN